MAGRDVLACAQKREQWVRYYGYYSNVSRGTRKKQNQDDLVPYIIETDLSSKACRKRWAQLIQKIYEVDPLTCPKCQGDMTIISFITDEQVIRKILKHLKLWHVTIRRPPKAHPLPLSDRIDPLGPEAPSADDSIIDPDYPVDAYLH